MLTLNFILRSGMFRAAPCAFVPRIIIANSSPPMRPMVSDLSNQPAKKGGNLLKYLHLLLVTKVRIDLLGKRSRSIMTSATLIS